MFRREIQPMPVASRRLLLAVCGFLTGMIVVRAFADAPARPDVVRASADAAARPYLVKDINTATLGGSSPLRLVDVNGTLYFVAADLGSGGELWKSDGTAAGTVRVADLVPGRTGSWPRALTDVGGRLFFVACNRPGGNDCALWTSDGTTDGTVRVAGIDSSPHAIAIHDLTAVGDRLYFFVDEPAERAGLWKTDGTAGGTSLVIGIAGTHLLTRNGTLYFVSDSSLYESDGTAAGTHALDIGQPIEREVLALGDELFFTTAGGNTAQLWKTDGTRAGTTFLADIGQAFGDGDGPALQVHLAGVTLANGAHRLFFRAWFDECEVWTSDGTPAGTVRLMTGACLQDDDKDPDEPPNLSLASLGDVVVFSGCNGDQTTNCEPWRTDGTPAGTAPLADIYPGLDGSDPSQFITVGDAIFFIAFSPDGGWGLWKTDGTSSGTVRLANAAPSYFRNDYPGAVAPALGALAPVGRTLFLSACDARTGCELWKSDGTAAGTRQVADLVPNSPVAGSRPDDLTAVGHRLFFQAEDPEAGRELWQSDGTADGTTRIADLTPGVLGSTVQNLTAAGDLLFFTRSPSWDRNEVWRTDGTEAGTVRLVAGAEPQWYADDLVAVGATLWFVVESPEHTEIWKSDGTVGGTVAVAEVPGLDAWTPPVFTAAGKGLFYRACDLPTGCELWRTDTVTGVTGEVVDLCPGPLGSYPSELTNLGGTLYFAAVDTIAGWELWRSDGTAAGTMRLTDIGPGRIDSYPTALTAAGGFLYFAALQGPQGYGLWRTDGTPTGTIQLAPPGANGTDVLTPVNGSVFFRRCEVATGCELWRSDGTPDGTRMVVDLVPGPVSSNPELLGNVGGVLFFATLDPAAYPFASNLWATDGTAAGTVRVGGAPLPGLLTVRPVLAGGTLFFRLDDGTHGAELWAMSAGGYPTVPPPPLCAGGCDDQNPCTQDVCNAAGRCAHSPVAGACDDGDGCTLNDTCSAGRCTAGDQRSCNDGNPCTADSCIPGRGCVNVNVPNACDDGNACTIADVCIAGRCSSRDPLDCDDGNPCTLDGCDRVRGCVHKPVDDPCNDGDRCTLDDRCDAGSCHGSVLRDCDDGNPCTLDTCRPDRGCEHQWVEGTCNDGDACTAGDTCQAGLCLGVLNDLECVDALLCRGLAPPAPPRVAPAHTSSAAETADAPPVELCSSLAEGSAFARYPLSEPSRHRRAVVKVFNRFGTSVVEPLRGSSVLERTTVAGDGPPTATRDADRYRCRRVRGTRGPKLAAPHPLTVRDAFTGARRDVVVRMPYNLCTPADTQTERTALLCYRAATFDAVSDARPIVARNRFGTVRARSTRVQTVCLPSTILP